MTGLEEAFYIISIIYMGVMFLLILVLITAVFVIRGKINKIHDQIEARVNAVTTVAEKSGEVAAAVVGAATRKAKRAVSRR